MSIKFLSLPILACTLASCQKIDLGEYANATNDDTYSVKITSKSGSGTSIPMPLTVYAVNDDGLVESKASITDNGSSVNLTLRSGDFTFYALAGETASESDVPSSNVVTTENGYFTQPVMLGNTQKKIDDDAELSLFMAHAVAAVDVTMENVPTEVTAVSVKIGNLRNSLTIEGEYDGSSTTTLELTEQSDGTTWKSDVAYVFPSVSAPTTLTFTQTFADNTTQSYIATYNAKLLAGTPYHFNGAGTNTGSNNLTINVTMGDWDAEINEILTLTPIGSGDGSGSMSSDGETYLVSKMPQATDAGTILDGKYVLAYVNGNQGLLYAVKDCDKDKTAEYKEVDVTGWVVPTLQQYNDIKAQATAQKISNVINTLTGKSLNYNSDHYYYCDGCTKAFSWAYNQFSPTGEVALGKSDKTYHLRLVKEVTFKLKD